KRITSYTRSETVARIPECELLEMADAGLNRLHIGMETASDTILKLVRKGVTKDGHIAAGLKVKNAGIQLSEYVLTGIGGEEFSQLHAVETADAINQINPDFIRFRTLHLPDKINLFPDTGETSYQWASDLVIAKEILSFLEHLDGITSKIKSDHSYNLFQEIDGIMPKDKERLIQVLKSFINMPREDRMLFQVGKRGGYFLRLTDMQDSFRVREVENICRQTGINVDNADERIHEIIQERMRMGMPF
ncbi:MAG: radical SAM protein, partial [Deltaproteobacteria bacterium]